MWTNTCEEQPLHMQSAMGKLALKFGKNENKSSLTLSDIFTKLA